MRDELSIVIPYYNGREHICECIDSLLLVKSPKEILIIDDGSTDGGGDFLEKCYSHEESIRVYKKSNGGIVSARNFGLEKSSGKYILFVDQDDIVDANCIDDTYHQACNEKIDMCFWSTNFLSSIDRRVWPCDTVLKSGIYDELTTVNDLIVSMLMYSETEYVSPQLGHVWAGMYSLELIRNNDISFLKFYDCEDDYLFILNVLKHSKKLLFTEKCGYFWRVNPNSYSHNRKYIEDIDSKLSQYYNYLEKEFSFAFKNKEQIERYQVLAMQYQVFKLVRNSALNRNLVKQNIGIIKNLLSTKNFINAFKHEPVSSEWQFRLIYYLCRHRLVTISVCVMRLNYYLKKRNKNE